MEFNVMLQRKDGVYTARVPLIPGLTRTGESKESTIAAIREAIEAFLASVEYVEWITIEVPDPDRSKTI